MSRSVHDDDRDLDDEPNDVQGDDPAERPLADDAWPREGSGVEFDRVVNFTDAVFAIALTLIIVEISVPVITQDASHSSVLLAKLREMLPQFISFFAAFVIIGRYWVAHHALYSVLRAVDERMIGVNLLYLAFVAFLPFPVGLVGEYYENPISVALLALCLSAISSLETVELRHAHFAHLFKEPMDDSALKWATMQSLLPVAVMVASLPVAFLWPLGAVLLWLTAAPLGVLLDKKSPSSTAAKSTIASRLR